MSEHRATIRWKNSASGSDFLKGQYSREHTWTFDGGVVVPASPSPHVVKAPWSNSANVDPEEAFVASISSCHFLTFVYVASQRGFQVDAYEDEAVGIMTKNERRVPWVSKVVLTPRIVYGGDRRPTADEEAALHEAAHEGCFIANSVRTEIVVNPVH